MPTPRPTSIAREKVNDGPYLGKQGLSQVNRSREYCQREERVSRDLTLHCCELGGHSQCLFKRPFTSAALRQIKTHYADGKATYRSICATFILHSSGPYPGDKH